MKMKLSYKLFAAFLLTAIIILALMVVIVPVFAYRNFSNYVNQTEIGTFDNLVNGLSDQYQTHQGWNLLKKNPDQWIEIVRETTRKERLNNPEKSRLAQGAHVPPPLLPHDRFDGRSPPPHIRFNDRPPPRPGLHPLLQRLSLFDDMKYHIAGSVEKPDTLALREITVDGKIVGWIGLSKREHLSHPLGIAFLKQQVKGIYITACAIFIIAAIISFFLSRHLLSPIKQLAMGTKALSSLKFDTRINVYTEDELGQLAVDFNEMAKTLERYERSRQQWISDISHELRTPLSILRGEIEALQDGVRKMNSDTLDSLHAEAICLTKIVNDLHDLSLAESGALFFNKRSIDPISVLEETLSLFQTQFKQHQITVIDTLEGDLKLALHGDSDRLTQLFSNLFENAVKYTDKPGTLTVWQVCTENELTFFFEDSGPGVPERSVDRIFDRLYRVDPSRNRSIGGSGLGLSICKSIVEAHDGTIEASNVPSGGLRFEIVFPLTLK